ISERYASRTADRVLAGMLGPVTCIIQLEMGFGYALDEKRLERAVYLVTRKIPLLGCCFVPNPFRPCFQRLGGDEIPFCLVPDRERFERVKHERMDFFNGPQIDTCLYRSSMEDRFLIKVSHLVCDAAGVKEIAGELSNIYNRLKDEPSFEPKPDPEDYRGFWQILRQIPWYAVPGIIKNYFREIIGSKIPGQSHVLPVRKVSDDKMRFFTRDIDGVTFARVYAYAKERGATINDVLTTAIIRALSKTGNLTDDKVLRLGMAIDLRRYLPGKKARSIANFSAFELFNYGNHVEKDFASTLRRVTEKINKRKSSWLGLSTFVSTYPVLWSLPFFVLKAAGRKGWEVKARSPNSFDWLTNMGVIPKDQVNFGGHPSSAWLLVPGCVLPMLFFGCSSYNGRLTFSWSIGPDESNREVTRAFFDLVVSELASIAG
ncbi:MAG: condensation domain-containing protein, partial [Desulfobacterales bacterium]|nr:condensation domain-containing protein [Desulfobacterales bacterium]